MNTILGIVSPAEALADPAEIANPPNVSIVVTNHNYARFLRQSVESALYQDYPSVEVVVVDDGSTDESRDVIASLQKAHGGGLKAVLRQNGGQAAAMNSGFLASTGEWVMFLDSDDALDPQALALALRVAPAEASILQFFLRTIDDRGACIGLHPFCHVVEGGDMFAQICASGHFRFMPTSANLFRRAALERVLPIPERSWRICADTYVIFAAALQGVVRVVPEILGSYRIHDANRWYGAEKSEGKLRQIIRNHIIVWTQLLGILEGSPAHGNGYARLSLIRRICISLHLYQRDLPLLQTEIAGTKRKLLRSLLGAKVALREKLLHLAILWLAQSSRAPVRSAFRSLLVRQARISRWSKLIGILETSVRHDWLGPPGFARDFPELQVGRRIDFGHGGEGRRFHRYGFGETENWRSWATAERAGLAFRLPQGVSRISLDIELAAYVCEPWVKSQRIRVLVGKQLLFTGEIKGRTRMSLDIAAAMAGRDRLIGVDFMLSDAVVPALVDGNSPATRLTSIALVSMTASQSPAEPQLRHPPVTLGTRVAAATGALQQLLGEGWVADGGLVRLQRRVGKLHFSMPNPVMDRFAIRLEFGPVPADAKGDWQIGVDLPNVGKDSIDLRETLTAIVIVPRGSAPKDGLFELTLSANNILPAAEGEPHLPGPRLKYLVLQPFEMASGALSLWRSGQVVEFAQTGNGRKYLLDGWHKPDARGSWSMDTVAAVGGYYFEDPAEVFLTLRLSSWLAAGAPEPQRVKIKANATTIVERHLQGTEDVLAIVPNHAIGSDRYLRIEIGCAFVGSPHAFEGAGDQRPLGFCLEKLVIGSLRRE